MSGLPRRLMSRRVQAEHLRLAQPIMIGCDAALATALRAKGLRQA